MASAPTSGDPSQAAQLSDLFLQFSMALDQYRSATDLSAADAQRLGTIARQLDELSDQLNAAAIGQILQNLQPNIDDIVATTKSAQEAIKKANEIQKVMNIAGAALCLASAVLTGNPQTVLSALGGVASAVAGSASTPGAGNAGGGATRSGS